MAYTYRNWLIDKHTELRQGQDWDTPIYQTRDCLTGHEFLYLALRRMGYNKYAEAITRSGVLGPERLLWLDHSLGRITDTVYYRERAQLADLRRERELAQAEREEQMMEVRAQQSGTKEWAASHNTLKILNQRKR